MTKVNIARQFSRHPIGRYLDDSDASGQAFRERFLVPSLKHANAKLQIELDGVAGFPSSFLEEAFGGLIREEGFTREELRKRLELVHENESYKTYVEEVWFYVDEAERAKSDLAVAM